MASRMRNVLKFLVFIGLGFGILYLLYQNQQAAYAAECVVKGIPAEECSLVDKVINDFRGAHFGWLLLTIAAYCVSNLSRALRWNQLLAPFGHQPRLINSFLALNLGYFANLGFPRLGEIAGPAALAKYEELKLERVMGTVVLGRVIDVISILLLSALALWLASDQLLGWLNENVDLTRFVGLQWLLSGIVTVGVVVLALAWFQRDRIAETKVGGKVVDILKGFAEGLQSILKLDRPVVFVLHSINIWLMYFLMTLFTTYAFAPTAAIGPEGALVTFVAGGWGIVIPSPGGMGTYHFLAQSALGLYGVPGEDGFSWANISFFAIQIGANVLIGLLALLLLPRINRHYSPRTDAPAAAPPASGTHLGKPSRKPTPLE